MQTNNEIRSPLFFLRRKLTSIIELMHMGGGYFLIAMMLITTANVAGRYFANSPIGGSYELTGLLLVCLAASAFPVPQIGKGHVRVTFLLNHLPPWCQACLNGISSLVGFAGTSIICWRMFLRAKEYLFLLRGGLTEDLSIPYYPFMFILSFGFGLLALMLLLQSLHSFSTLVKK